MTSWRKIRKDIETTAPRYLVCVSGGVDSVFLLNFMARSNVYIEVAHYDHGIRDDSYIDAALVARYADEMGLILHVEKSETLDTRSNEVDARTARWSFVERIARERRFTHIMTAHHADDNVENILLRLMRGDPHHALSMQTKLVVGDFTRYKPLLDVPKEILIKQARHFGLEWREDETNLLEKYDRNFVRHTLLPMMATRTNIYRAIRTGIEKTKVLQMPD